MCSISRLFNLLLQFSMPLFSLWWIDKPQWTAYFQGTFFPSILNAFLRTSNEMKPILYTKFHMRLLMGLDHFHRSHSILLALRLWLTLMTLLVDSNFGALNRHRKRRWIQWQKAPLHIWRTRTAIAEWFARKTCQRNRYGSIWTFDYKLMENSLEWNLYTLPNVSFPTIYGEMKPGQIPIKPFRPSVTPEKFGLKIHNTSFISAKNNAIVVVERFTWFRSDSEVERTKQHHAQMWPT